MSKGKDSYNEHSRNSPSGSATWLNCPGSIIAAEDIEDKGSVYAAEGTLAHDYAEKMLKENLRTLESVNAFTGKSIDPDMFEHLLGYCQYVESLNIPREDWMVEKTVPLFYNLKDKGGTVDFAGVTKYHELVICDLKYGKGYVSAESNTQLIIYALSVIDQIKYSIDIAKVRCIIYQPRLSSVSEAEYTWAELLTYRNKILTAEKLTWSPSAERIPTTKGCKWCKARFSCPARAKENLQSLSSDFEDLDKVAELELKKELTDSQIRAILVKKPEIVSWLTSIETGVINSLVGGNPMRGMALHRSKSSETWADETKVIEKLKQLGKADLLTTKIPTPKQVRKIMKGEFSDLESDVTEIPGKTLRIIFEKEGTSEFE